MEYKIATMIRRLLITVLSFVAIGVGAQERIVFDHLASEGQIRSLYVDRAGVLWVGTWSQGLNRYNAATEDFTRYTHDPDDPESLSRNHVARMYEDSKGTFWVSTSDGPNELGSRTGPLTYKLVRS